MLIGGLVGSAPTHGNDASSRNHRNGNRRHGPAGRVLFPDLRTLPPADLVLARLGDGTHILRFSNTVWNAGEGRLELESEPQPAPDQDTVSPLYQNLYDAPTGGRRVRQRRVRGIIAYHPTHAHYHFADFASYLLLRRDAAGHYQPVGASTKTSFCLTDGFRRARHYPAAYLDCERELQGLTPGWADRYAYYLPEQWVTIGAEPLSDGEYGLRSTADPKRLLDEGSKARERNNATVTYFTVSGGTVLDVRSTPTRT